jgi:hypothetical protein
VVAEDMRMQMQMQTARPLRVIKILLHMLDIRITSKKVFVLFFRLSCGFGHDGVVFKARRPIVDEFGVLEQSVVGTFETDMLWTDRLRISPYPL